jgi:DNA repair exonuclease SbcCD ATPase subunit
MSSYKLSLKNFKCFSNYSVEIDKEAIILFDGPSGIGKSSLIQAFLYAITGEGKKLFKQGTKSLTVELEKIEETHNKQFKIVRKKGPESLCVYDGDKCYEDDEAQVRIDNHFGKNFINTSVIKQKGESSFLSSSAKDKMVFLQSLLFSNSSIEKQKDRVNDMIKCCKDEMSALSVKKNTLEEVLKNLISRMNNQVEDKVENEKYSNLSMEECDRKIKSRQHKIQEQQNNLQKTINLLQEQQRLKSVYNNEEIKYKQIHSKLSIYEEQKAEISKKETEMKEKFNETSYEELLSEITVIRNMIKYIKQKTKCMDTQKVLLEQISKSLFQIEKEEQNDNDKNIDESKYNDYCDKRDLLKKRREVSKKLEECDYEEDDIINKKDIVRELKQFLEKAELYKSSLKCPHCNHSVRLNNSVLEKLETVSEDFTKAKIQEKQKELKQVEQLLEKLENSKKLYTHYSTEEENINKKLETYDHISIEKISELTDVINKIEEIKTTRRELKKRKTALLEERKKVEDFSHDQLKQDYTLLQKYKNSIKNECEDVISLDEYESKLSDLLVSQKEQEKIKDDVDLLNDKKRILLKEIKNIGVSIDTCNEKLSILEEKLEEVDESIDKYEDEIKQIRENDKQSEWTEQINILNIQKLNVENKNEKIRLEKEVETLFERYKQFERDCVNYNIIAEGIEHSESLLLAKFIDTINHNLSIHLDSFFEEPMHVQIKTFKESKSNKEKPVINMEIFYKGNETDLSNLSGGEYDRLNLALTLTFNCISNSPVLILDESLASINQELSTEIIMHLKETISHKLVWMTQHQAVKGMFDKVFQISL